MTKQARQTGKRARRDQTRARLPGDCLQVHVEPRTQPAKKPWRPLTDAQAALNNAIDVYPITFAIGEFGTGKTFVPAAKAADAYLAGKIKRIIITRPAVGADEEYGFFPGELEDKVAPWAAPVIRILEERLGKSPVELMLERKQIEVCPLGLMRGHTFSDAFVILDEAQNTTPKQMKLFLSRIGEGTKMVIDGDLEQMDIAGPSGLADAIKRFRDHEAFGYVEFGVDDIVRSGIAREVCLGYSPRAHSRVPAFFEQSIAA